jgi:hypothetical protein
MPMPAGGPMALQTGAKLMAKPSGNGPWVRGLYLADLDASDANGLQLDLRARLTVHLHAGTATAAR